MKKKPPQQNTLNPQFIDFFKNNFYPKSVVHFKNVVNYQNRFYFEDLFRLLELSNFRCEIKHHEALGLNHKDIFSHVFEIFNIRGAPKINPLHHELCHLFKKNPTDKNFRPDIFTSFKGSIGNTHIDHEDVFIIGLCGTTYYNIPSLSSVYEVQEGDAIYIPKKTAHAAHSFTKRIVVSWSRWV